MSNIQLVTFQMDIQYSYATQLCNHSQMDIRYSVVKCSPNHLPDDDLIDRYSMFECPTSPSDHLTDGHLILEY